MIAAGGGGGGGAGGGGGGSVNNGFTPINMVGGTGNGQVTITYTAEPPTIFCPGNITVSNDPNQCSAVVNYPNPTVLSICPATFNCSPPSGSTFNVGTTTVTCTATNAAGSTSCSFTITVNDKEPPMINCPADVTQANDPGQCGAIVNYPPPTVTDNCPGATAVCSPASGSFFPVGTTMVTCTATDASGNTSTCTFNVTVIRIGPSCPPANFTVF